MEAVPVVDGRDGGVMSSPPMRSNTAGPDFGGGTGSDKPEVFWVEACSSCGFPLKLLTGCWVSLIISFRNS